jgi:LacI family transcriptional regulator
MAGPNRVILVIESSRAYGRGCLQGIGAYVRHQGGWQTLHIERGLEEELPAAVNHWSADGIVARIESQRMADLLAKLHCPIVDLRGSFSPEQGAIFDTDHHALAQMVVDHFAERGLRRLAFCGYPDVDFSEHRRLGLEQTATQAQFEPPAVYEPTRQPRRHKTLAWERLGEFDETDLADWLDNLPKPVGVFACNDMRGRQVLAAAASAGLAVPDELAVVGVDNDEVICDLASPPLSSLEPDTFRLGYEGAAMLQRLMDGQTAPAATQWIEPRRIAVRRSSDVVAVDDAQVAEAARFIRDHAGQALRVDDVMQQVTVSRATLERRFRAALGHSPRDAIEQARMNRVKELLMETDYTLETIATMTGFNNPNHLATRFKICTGQTPGGFRASRGHRTV